MQIAKSVNSENANIVPREFQPRLPHLHFSDIYEKSVELPTINLNSQVGGNFILACTENSSCVEPWHSTLPWQWSRRWAEQQEHQQTGECTGAACANMLPEQTSGRQSKMSPPKLSLEGWARRICQALKTDEDSSLREQLVQKYSFGWEISGKSRNKVRHLLQSSGLPQFSFQKLTK